MTAPVRVAPPYRLVVFDFDGTLADSARWMRGVIDEMAIKHHFKRVHDDEIELLRGKGTRDILAYLGIEAWRLPFIARDVRRLSLEAAPSLSLFEGIPALLRALHERSVAIAVVTSNAEETVRTVLGPSAALVQHYACGASLFGKARKLAAVARKLGLEGSQVLCLGDETRDIEAAREVGLTAGAVTWGYANETVLRDAAPDRVFDRVADVAALFGA